ncbi:hypothetical protein CRX42_16735 [Pseudomonas jessenii]|jgi:hypothetical protein|uniref:Uncharacterized protein n=1 Tax=Pseudomonas jessenii TaxID=77298 RepID=A0A2W0EN72_PSEJE|nr:MULTISPECIES: hypothetical protein [Pseudomonas]PYY69407.1 hypothetical protein CRX42_16735 [Pseudomonas jessenii]WPN28087.1 hypothetical protein QMK54_19885 [Pseudomonas sp. P5_109]
MCTLTHFAYPLEPEPLHGAPNRPRFQVVMAGNAFFHIKDISTGCVRGFRASHNEACALARFLESHP